MDFRAIDEALRAFGKTDEELARVRAEAVKLARSLGPAEAEALLGAPLPVRAPRSNPPPGRALGGALGDTADEETAPRAVSEPPRARAGAAAPPPAIEMQFEDDVADRVPAPPGSVPPPADDYPSVDIFAGMAESSPPPTSAVHEEPTFEVLPSEVADAAGEATAEHQLPEADEEDFELLIEEDES